VPKPQTPFQWFGQDTIAELRRKINLLRDATRGCAGSHCAGTSPRRPPSRASPAGGPAHGAVIERVWRAGGTFQEWSEHFDLGLWTDALAARVSASTRPSTETETSTSTRLGSHLCRAAPGLPVDRLLDALAEAGVEDCRWTPCYDCGACTGAGVEHVVASAVPPAGGSQGTGQDLSSAGAVPVRFVGARS